MTFEEHQRILKRQEEIKKSALEAAGFTFDYEQLDRCHCETVDALTEAGELVPSIAEIWPDVDRLIWSAIGELEDKAMKDAGTYDEYQELEDRANAELTDA